MQITTDKQALDAKKEKERKKNYIKFKIKRKKGTKNKALHEKKVHSKNIVILWITESLMDVPARKNGA